MTYSIREVAANDLPAVARVHIAAFPGSLLTRLGSEIVSRYYAWQLSDANDAAAVVADEESELLGFAVGGMFRDSLNGFYRANLPLIKSAVLRRPWLVLDPLLWSRWNLLRTSLRRSSQRKAAQAAAAVAGAATTPRRRRYVILSVATHPAHRRRGVAGKLISFHEARANDLGIEQLWLSVNPQNEAAQAFYRSRGWTVHAESSSNSTTKMTKLL